MIDTILVKQSFYKSIPQDKKELILGKVESFANDLMKANHDLTILQNSYYIREIVGREKQGKIFKFRVNSGERILFTYGSQCNCEDRESKDTLVILEYVEHDNQQIKGRVINLLKNKYLKYEFTSESEFYNKYKNEYEDVLNCEIDKEYIKYDINLDKYITRVVKIKDLVKFSEEDNIFYLSNEQFNCLDSRLDPLFIKGGAGTGKTTIGINKLHSLCEIYEKIGYFTFSPYLKKEVSKYFNKLFYHLDTAERLKDNVEFNSINEYLFKAAYGRTIKINDLVTFLKFTMWYNEKIIRFGKYSNISTELFDIWKEIRGVIKGVSGKNWSGGEFDLKKRISTDTIEILLSIGSIYNLKDDKYRFNMNYSEILKLIQRHKIDGSILDEITNLDLLMMEYISQNALITLNEYLELSDEFSIYSVEEKKIIYEIAVKYQSFLKTNNYVDENDIARAVLHKIAEGKIEKFDYIMLDEIQDLTEIQIYTLYNLSKDSKNFYMNGDLNQTINPTLFRINRIESLFKSFNKDILFTNKTIKTNYRNSLEIIKFTNKIVDIRNKIFNENESKMIGYRTIEDKPILLKKNEENKLQLFKIALDRAYVAIIVPDEEEKDKLISSLKEIYSEDNLGGSVLTVNEIKGLERKYVICYNLISKFKEEWNYMMKHSSSLKSEVQNISRFKFYFNILYVAITRAQDNICFYEEEENLDIFKALVGHIKYIEEFDIFDLRLDKESTSYEYYKAAKDFEKLENYDAAIRAYKSSMSKKGAIGQLRCTGKKLIQEGNIEEAVKYLIKSSEYSLVAECYEALNSLNLAAEYYYKAENYSKSLEVYKIIGNKTMTIEVLNCLIKEKSNTARDSFNKVIDKVKVISK